MESADANRRGKDGAKSSYVQQKNSSPSWACRLCTFFHVGPSKTHFLSCEICGASREEVTPSRIDGSILTSSPRKTASFTAKDSKTPHSSSSIALGSTDEATPKNKKSWGSLRAPTEKDIRGPRKRHKALDAPPPMMDYLIVLDFEWTADNQRKMLPVAEITHFPSVVLKLVDKVWGSSSSKYGPSDHRGQELLAILDTALLNDLIVPCNFKTSQDAYAISSFDSFIRPTLNPKLTKFSIDLTAITQVQVDAAPTIDKALDRYMKWLESINLVDNTNGNRIGNWSFCSWGDGDIMQTLREELAFKSIAFPPCFDRWINLKNDSVFKRHYGREPRGGLRACVESASVGASWQGRAHNGFVDSVNTAKIVRHMVQTGYRFTRSTRGLDRNGVPFGQAAKRQSPDGASSS
jgi:inhibitor of KinA sporulation pathway (predicted exonuclease)